MQEIDLLLIFGEYYLLDALQLLLATCCQLENLLKDVNTQRVSLSV